MITRNKKGLNFNFILAMAIFMAVLLVATNIYAQKRIVTDRPVGTAQTSLYKAATEADKALLYLDASANLSATEAAKSFSEAGGFLRDPEGGNYPCGELLYIPYWYNQTKTCIPDFEENLKHYYKTKLFNHLRDHPIYTYPYGFSLTLTEKGNKTDVYGEGLQELNIRFGGGGTKGFTNKKVSSFTPDYPQAITPETLNYGSRNNKEIDTIVLHYTASGSLSSAVNTLRNKGFSYHYIIDHDGTIYQYVPEEQSAQHAGCLGTECLLTNMNTPSIGISFINCGYEMRCGDPNKERYEAEGKKWETYTEEQLGALVGLLADIATRNPQFAPQKTILADKIIYHSDIKKTKQDPGPAFDKEWQTLLQAINDKLANPAQRIPYTQSETGVQNTNQLTGQVSVSALSTYKQRLQSYESIIQKYADLNELDPAIIKALIIHESRGLPEAKSPANALGLMQIVPFYKDGGMLNHNFCVQTCGFTEAATADKLKEEEYYDPEKNICCGSAFFARLTKKNPIEWDCSGVLFDQDVHIQTTYDEPYEIGARRYNGAACASWVDPDYVESIMGLYAAFGGNPTQQLIDKDTVYEAQYRIPLSFHATIPINLNALKGLETFVKELPQECVDDINNCVSEQLQNYNQQNNYKLTTNCHQEPLLQEFIQHYSGCQWLQDKTECTFTLKEEQLQEAYSILFQEDGIWQRGGLQAQTQDEEDELKKTPIITQINNTESLIDNTRQQGDIIFQFTNKSKKPYLDISINGKRIIKDHVEDLFFTYKKEEGKLIYTQKENPKQTPEYYATHFLCTEEDQQQPFRFAMLLPDRVPPAVKNLKGQYKDYTVGLDQTQISQLTGELGRYEIQWDPVTMYEDGLEVKDIKTYKIYCSLQPFPKDDKPEEEDLSVTITRKDDGNFLVEEYSGRKMGAAIEKCGNIPILPPLVHIAVVAEDYLGQANLQYPKILLNTLQTGQLDNDVLETTANDAEKVVPPPGRPFPLSLAPNLVELPQDDATTPNTNPLLPNWGLQLPTP